MAVVKKIIDIDVVDVALNFIHIHLVLLWFTLLVVTLLTAAVRIVISLLKPSMSQYLRYCKAVSRLKLDHRTDNALSFK